MITIIRGATTPLIFPIVDKDNVPMDLRTVDVCFLLVGGGVKLKLEPGDEGCSIVGHGGASNNALSVVLSPAETSALKYGRVYTYWVWLKGDGGEYPAVSGGVRIVDTQKCEVV